MLRFACTLAVALTCAGAAAAQSDETGVPVDSALDPAFALAAPALEAEPAAEDTPQPSDVPSTDELSEHELADVTGGDTIIADASVNTRTNQNLNATNGGNTITAGSVVNGDVNLDANAFTGFNGIGNFVVNTGNNNNLQGALSVTIINP